MSLPKFPTRRETIEIQGEFIPLRSLTRAESARFQKAGAAGMAWDELEMEVIAAASETPLDEVAEWYQHVPPDVVEIITDAIRKLSGLAEEAQKSGRDRAGPTAGG